MTLRFGVVTISDRSYRGEREDGSGPAIQELVKGNGWVLVEAALIPDELPMIRHLLAAWADSERFDVILTTGGTGFSPRDVTPEGTRLIIDRDAPGMAEAMRSASLVKTPHAMLSRAIAGIRGRTLIVNLPGSPKGAVENLQVVLPVLPHAVQLLHGDPGAEAGHTTA